MIDTDRITKLAQDLAALHKRKEQIELLIAINESNLLKAARGETQEAPKAPPKVETDDRPMPKGVYLSKRPRRTRKPVVKGKEAVEFLYVTTDYIAYAKKLGIGSIEKNGHPRYDDRDAVWLTRLEAEACAKRASNRRSRR